MALLEASHLTKIFTRGSRLSGRTTVRAVDDVSIAVEPGEALGLVGESGCGKSTTGRLLLRLVEPTSGTVSYRGTNLHSLDPRALREVRREVQMVFQDPFSSLNPRMRVLDLVGEPLDIHRIGRPASRRDRVTEVLALVGLDETILPRYPSELSGGQRQRIGLARALVLEPALLVLDEPVSALDVSVQAQIANLLTDLQQRLHLSYVFISHDLRIVAQLCSRVACMYAGRIIETGPTTRMLSAPAHPYTQALVSAIPSGDPDRPRRRQLWDPEAHAAARPLRELAPGHWAAL
jgi:peptide/nickel transport system ATP-binding protein/oligopeptide transport system ATP-binding protein